MKPHMTLAEFESLVDAFGADKARWPEPRASAAKALLALNDEARALWCEAEALDRLLATAPPLSANRLAALTDRIAAAAEVSPRIVASNEAPAKPDPTRAAKVVPLPVRQQSVRAEATATPSAITVPRGPARSIWRASAALAAALVLGVTIGSFDLSPLPMQSLFQLSAADTDVEQLVAALGADSITTQYDEDPL